MTWRLAESLEVGGTAYKIRTDFRDVLTIISALNDPDLTNPAKVEVMLRILYVDFESIPPECMEEAVRKANEFICHGTDSEENRQAPRVMDFDQDADLIASAINKNIGTDIRALPYLHWWTFLGYYMEIGESLFSQVMGIRYKRAKGKKLDKWEREFEKNNRRLITLKRRVSEEERERAEAERQALKDLIGE